MYRRLMRKMNGSHRSDMLKLSDRVSKLLLQAVIALLFLLLISQAALQNDTIRGFLTSADRWEGTRLN
jgi:hypothetical protein